MDATRDTIATALAEQQAELAGLLAPLDDDGWDRPSRCEGWTVSDVVLHLAQTNELAVASLEGRFAEATGQTAAGGLPSAGEVDDGADRLVADERGEPAAAVHARWQASTAAFDRLIRASDPHLRVQWVAGELSARTLATTRLAETWIHCGDVAAAFGVALVPADRLRHVARLAWRTLPYAFAQAGLELAGPVAFELHGPSGEPWHFRTDGEPPVTIVSGAGAELCTVAARRVDPAETGLHAEGPDAAAVLRLVRTYA